MTMPQTPLELWAEVPFSSSGEMIEAMGNPLYKNSGMPGSAAFVAAVEAKIAISDGIGTGSVNIGRVAQRVVMGGIGDEGPSLEQQGESFGPGEGVSKLAKGPLPAYTYPTGPNKPE